MDDLIVDALALHRLTRLATTDRLTAQPRELLLRRIYKRAGSTLEPIGERERGTINDEDPPSLATLLVCPWCMSVWIGAGVALARRLAPKQWQPVAAFLASATISGGIAEWLEH